MLGGVIGGLGGHFKKGIARDDAKEFGDLIDAGQATLLVIGESRLEEQLDKVLTRAEKTIEKEIDVDNKEFKRELDKAEREHATAQREAPPRRAAPTMLARCGGVSASQEGW